MFNVSKKTKYKISTFLKLPIYFTITCQNGFVSLVAPDPPCWAKSSVARVELESATFSPGHCFLAFCASFSSLQLFATCQITPKPMNYFYKICYILFVISRRKIRMCSPRFKGLCLISEGGNRPCFFYLLCSKRKYLYFVEKLHLKILKGFFQKNDLAL